MRKILLPRDMLIWVKNHWVIISLSVLFFSTRLMRLNVLPIFNDEAIYLDWGWRSVTVPGFLFYSLYDAKQPLVLWLFGLSQMVFSDPLIAGRTVSVLCGFCTLIALFRIARENFAIHTAIIAGVLYIVSPLFIFYDRQALMESAISACALWATYYVLQTIKHTSKKNSVLLGMVWGLGLFIKTNFVLFIITHVIILMFYVLHQRKITVKPISLSFAVTLITDFLLLIQPQFWTTLPSNSRYSYTLTQMITQSPIGLIQKLWGDIQIISLYIFPFTILLVFFGLVYVIPKGKRGLWSVLVLLPMLFELILVKESTQRYLVSFLPILLIPISVSLYYFLHKRTVITLILIFVMIGYMGSVSILQIFNPVVYFNTFAKITPYSDRSFYITHFTSGYPFTSLKEYMDTTFKKSPVIIGVGVNIGNPESALFSYYKNSHTITITYLDASVFPDIKKYDCIKTNKQIYFVSRGENLAGLNHMFIKEKEFHNPYSNNFYGLYKMKDCTTHILTL